MRYSPALYQHFLHPVGVGTLEGAHGTGLARHPACGDATRVFVRLNVDGTLEARFQATGCGPGVACASVLMTLLVGADLDRVRTISTDEIAVAIDLPPPKLHCAELAVHALRLALHDACSGPHRAPLDQALQQHKHKEEDS